MCRSKESYLYQVENARCLDHAERILDSAGVDLPRNDYEWLLDKARPIKHGLIEAGRIFARHNGTA